jgi:hypothetical protein
MELEFSQQIFFKKFHISNSIKNPSNGSWVVPCARTDGHDEAKSRFSQFCQRAKKREQNYNRNQEQIQSK